MTQKKRFVVKGYVETEATVRRTLEAFRKDLQIAIGESRQDLIRAIGDLEKILSDGGF